MVRSVTSELRSGAEPSVTRTAANPGRDRNLHGLFADRPDQVAQIDHCINGIPGLADLDLVSRLMPPAA
jgi:hypothetical protein